MRKNAIKEFAFSLLKSGVRYEQHSRERVHGAFVRERMLSVRKSVLIDGQRGFFCEEESERVARCGRPKSILFNLSYQVNDHCD